MSRSLEVTDTTVVIRPTPTTMWLWLFAFATALSWLFWKFTFYDTSPKALWLLLFPSMMLCGVILEFVQARIHVTTIDRTRNLVLIERLPRFGLPAKQRRYVLSDFAAVESHSAMVGRSLVCRVSLVTTGLRSLVLLNGTGGYGAKSFWHTPMPGETAEAVAIRTAVAKVVGLKDMGYRGTLGVSVVSYEVIDAQYEGLGPIVDRRDRCCAGVRLRDGLALNVLGRSSQLALLERLEHALGGQAIPADEYVHHPAIANDDLVAEGVELGVEGHGFGARA